MRLDGTKVFLSGDFGEMTREDVVAALQARGADVVDEIAPDVEVVFEGEDAGADVDAARELGVRVEDAAALKAALAGQEPARKAAAAPPIVSADVSAPGFDDDRSGKPAGPRAAPAAPSAQADPSAPPNPDRSFDKGSRVRIIGGREGVGEIGEIFWWGESKFGEGMRAGVTGEDGTKYWVDEEHLAWPDEDIDEEALEEAIAANVFGRGDRVRVKSGKDSGAEGTIFWWGESKWGEGMRAGIETDDGEKLWVDGEHLEAAADEDESDIPF